MLEVHKGMEIVSVPKSQNESISHPAGHQSEFKEESHLSGWKSNSRINAVLISPNRGFKKCLKITLFPNS